jgi:hypothetical protein
LQNSKTLAPSKDQPLCINNLYVSIHGQNDDLKQQAWQDDQSFGQAAGMIAQMVFDKGSFKNIFAGTKKRSRDTI